MNIISRVLTPNMQGDDVKEVQTGLRQLGFAIGAAEAGTVGTETQQAIASFQRQLNLPQTGTLDIATAQQLAFVVKQATTVVTATNIQRMQGRLLNQQGGAPLSGFTVNASLTIAGKPAQDAGSSVSSAEGLFTINVNAPGVQPGSLMLALTVVDPSGRSIFQTQIQPTLDTGALTDISVPITPAPSTSPLITAALQASNQSLPQDLGVYLNQRKITTLSDISSVGGLSALNDIPGGAQAPVVATLDAHADLIHATGDVQLSSALIAKGFLSTNDIIKLSRPAFVQQLQPGVSDFNAAKLHLIANTQHKIIGHIVGGLGVAQTQGVPTPDAEGILPQSCGCKDCEAAMSPLAYLADLIKYAVQYIDRDGQLVDVNTLSAMFGQPFGSLPMTCEAMNTPVRQVRLCVEILRLYIQATPPTAAQTAALAAAEKAYRAAAYAELLTEIGTSYEEIRLARVADAATRQALAEKLGVGLTATRPDNLDALLLDADADAPAPLAISEAVLESLFGLVDTTRDPLAAGPTPSLQTWQLAQLRLDWAAADRPVDPTVTASVPVIIDPDLIGLADFVNPVSTDPAFALFQARQTWVQTQLTALAAQPQTLAGFGAAVSSALGGTTLDQLSTLNDQDTAGIDISNSLAALNLSRAAFLAILNLRALLVGALPVLLAEWTGALNILVQVLKLKMFAAWRTEEGTHTILLGPDSFLIPASTVPLPTLLEWRADPDDRQNWQDILQARIDEENTAITALQAVVSTVENDQLPSLRDALVNATDAEGDSFELMNRWLSKRLLIDTQAGGCQMTTRIALAIDTLQNLIFSLANGQFQPYGEWSPIDNATLKALPIPSVVTPLVRAPDVIDLFTVGADGGVYTSAWNGNVDQPEWTPWLALSPASLFSAPTDSVVTAVARDAQHMDIFVVGPSGAVFTASWDGTAAAPTWTAWNAIGSTVTTKVALHSPIEVVSRNAQRLDAFYVGTDNQMYQGSWDGTAATPAWTGWSPIAAPVSGFSLPQGTSFAALARDANHINLVCCGAAASGSAIYTSLWDGTAATPVWSPWTLVGSASLPVAAGTSVSAVARDAQHLDVFALGADNLLHQATWDGTAATPAWSAWSVVGVAPLVVGRLAAPVALDSQRLAVYVIGANGAPAFSTVDYSASGAAWSAWASAGDPALHQVPGPGVVSAAQPLPHQVFLFIVGADGLVYTAPAGVEDWTINDDQFDDQWKWLGSYATWRSAMLVFLYPENILLPSLKRPTTGTFGTIMDNLRSETTVQASDICAAGAQYSSYFQDVCSMGIGASCESVTRIYPPIEKGCGDPSVPVYRSLFYMFGAGTHTTTPYWCSLDVSVVEPGQQQTFWEPIPGMENFSSFVGAVPYGSQGYLHVINLFYTTWSGGQTGLAYVQYDLEQQRWTGSSISLDVPNSPADFSVIIKQQEGEYNPPQLLFLSDMFLYQRTLNDQVTGWAEGAWKGINNWMDPDPLYPWTATSSLFGFTRILSAVAEGGSATSFYLTMIAGDGNTWVLYFNTGWIGNTPDEMIPRVMLTYNFGAVPGYQGASFSTDTLDIFVTFSSPAARYAVSIDDKWTTIIVAPMNYPAAGIEWIVPLCGTDPNSWKFHSRRFAYLRAEGSYHATFWQINPTSLVEAGTAFAAPQVKGPFLITDGLSTTELQVRAVQIQAAMTANAGQDLAITSPLQEAFYLLPMQFGYVLEAQGSYDDALSWYRTVYDYTQPENSRIIYYGLETEKTLPNTYALLSNWLLDPLNPHAIAQTRQLTYTRYTLQQIILCLLDYADSEFTQDTAESLERARTLYLIALSLMDSQALLQNLNGCSDVIGNVEIDLGDWTYAWEGLKTQVGLISDRAEMRTTLDHVTTLLKNTQTPIDQRVAQAQVLVKQALQTRQAATLQTVFAAQDKAYANAKTLLLSRQPALQDALAASRASVTDRFTNAVATVLQSDPENLPQAQIPFLRLPSRAPNAVASGPATVSPSAAPLMRVTPATTDVSARERLINLQRVRADQISATTVQKVNETRFGLISHQVKPIDLVTTVGGLQPTSVPLQVFFCVPPNPVLQSLRLRAELNLFKLRTCRNIAGLQRAVDPYSAPTDETSGLPSIGAGGTLVVPGMTSMKPTPYRYSVLIDRAKQIVQLAQQQEASMLSSLEKADAESYNLLKARQDMNLAQAQVTLSDLKVTEAQDGVTLAQDQRDRAQIQVDTYTEWIQQGLSGLEQDALDALGTAVDLSNAASDLQIAAAGVSAGAGVADMVVSLGLLGGGDVAQGLSSLAGSLSSRSQAKQLASSQEAMQASFERRQQDWDLSRDLAQQDVKIGSQQVTIAQDDVQISAQERQIASMTADNAAATVDFLTNKFTNVELYDWMAGVLQGVYSFLLQQATATAQMASNQLAFERQQTPPPYIQSDYWQTPTTSNSGLSTSGTTDRRGLTGAERLLEDIEQLDQFAFNTDQRTLQLTKAISVAQLAPLEFEQFRETGVLSFATPSSLFDQDFPGHYLRLIKQVRVSVIALVPATQGVKATLTCTGVSRVVVKGELFTPTIVRHDPEEIAFTAPLNATGLFPLDPQSDMLLPFESLGVDTQWQLSMPRAANFFDYNTIADIILAIDYTAFNDYDYRTQVLQTLPPIFSGERPYGFQDALADAWYDLNNPDQSATPMTVQWTTTPQDFPANLSDVRIQQVVLYFRMADGVSTEIPVTHLTFKPANGSATVGGGSTTVGGVISTRRGNGSAWLPMIGTPPFGLWELALPNTTAVKDLFAQGQIEDILFDITYGGRTPPWPS